MIQRLLRLAICASIIFNSQLSILNSLQAQTGWLPEKTHRLVNDYSGILSDKQRNTLEQRLVAFNDSTSNQILVVITPTLGGDDENAVAQRIGQTWGVGQQDFDNGVVILFKVEMQEFIQRSIKVEATLMVSLEYVSGRIAVIVIEAV